MSCSNWNLFMLLAISHVAVALFSYYCFSFYNNRHDDQQLVQVSLHTRKLDAVVFDINSSRSYDFFYFVLQWPGSYIPRPKNVPNNFTIHGLWPNYREGLSPANCPGSIFSKDKIASLVANLNVQWPSINTKKTNEQFWEHEWQKHGTSSEAELNQSEYFTASLLLKSRLDILKTLQNNGIAPNMTRKYSPTTITNILKREFKAPRISCNKNGSDYQLLEIRFCVDRNGANIIDCEETSPSKCGKEIKFPTIS